MNNEMTMHEFIERTAWGLRKMEYTPEYLIVRTEQFEHWQFDMDKLCDIPIIKASMDCVDGHAGRNYPVYPAFIDMHEHEIYRQTYFFQRGFDDYYLELK
jgi:hypothetical protein